MSFPPHLNRALLPPPGIPPQYAGFPSGGPMIPVHMGIMTPTSAVMVTSMPVVSKPPVPRKDIAAMRAKEIDENSGPTTTVFVGNISEKASDMLIRQLLAKCGIVLSWKRVQGASGKLQAFGFCEYKEPESTLRSLRLLHDLLIGERNLLVKVDAKTKAQLDEWKAKKKTSNGIKKAEDGGDDDEEVLDEETKKKDQIVKGAIDGLMREYAAELNAPSQDEDSQRRKRKKEKKEEDDINTIDMEEDKRDLISREISKFRDTHKKLEEEKDKREKERLEFERDRKDREKERERERERRDREREKEREREQHRERERERDRDKDRDKDRDRRPRERERERDWERERSRERSVDHNRARPSLTDRSLMIPEPSRDRDREKKRDQEDDEESYERRKLERKLRDKETAYQERLKNWELRERKKARDYAKETEREDERRREMMKEGKRLKEFLEDYDDDRDDPKYYRGSALQKRLRDREKEMEADERDRKREKEELEEIRQRLLSEGHPDPDAELRRMEEEEEERLRQPPIVQEPEPEVERERHRSSRDHRDRRGEQDRAEVRSRPTQSDDEVEEGEAQDYDNEEDNPDTKPCLKPKMRPITAAPSVSSASGNASPNTPGDESPCGIIIPHENSPPEALPQEEHRPKIGLSLKLGATGSPSQPNAGKRKKLPVDSVFDEEEADEQPRKRKLVPLDYDDDDKSLGVDGAGLSSIKGADNEEKRKNIKSLIEKIPTAKPELFSYPLDWTMVDTTLMERRVRPWINKKIIEYIGEEEATLVDFVCSKVMTHSMPQSILDDVAMVLDEEAEVFIVKMWRLLIYETEAKKIGLAK
ncbi:RNA-binding protein 25b isoform X1 [Hippoglossus hippoglossus]|uniref:RNA-binding protein 25b isoform X1 n=1 Tax=Hippoglossus hippoglossus TaxID=8267 RepID=UPI00148B486E|nr:RNA-binding protein 25b isoform X1 [Hippoglossus hippoglossus]